METAQAQPVPEQNTIVVPDAKVTSATTTEFGFASWSKPTPTFWKNLFIIFYSMNTSILGWIAVTHLLSRDQTYEIVCLFKFIVDPLCFIISKMNGIVPVKVSTNEPQTP